MAKSKADKFADEVKHLKNCLEAIEKLKGLRRELKAKLQKEGLRDEEEVKFADELLNISKNIEVLESAKLEALHPSQDSGKG